MLTFDGIWHFGEMFSSRMNPGFHSTGQMTDSVLWYGQAYVMDNEHRCILLMAFWMDRDTVTRSRSPLLCHSSTTITSCCSMIMHGPMLQGSVQNSWKLKTSQFLHGQHRNKIAFLNIFKSKTVIILKYVYWKKLFFTVLLYFGANKCRLGEQKIIL